MADPSAAMYGSVFLLSMRKVPYTKPYLTIDEQILLLRTRGMAISDSAQAERDLLRLGYYRLSGYWYPFRVGVAGNKPRKQLVQDNFCAGTNFEQVMQLYEFDRKLRLLFLDAIEIIETAVRVAIVFQLGKYGAWAHRDPHCLDSGFTGDSICFDAWIAKVNASEKRAGKTEFVRHFNEKYSDPYLPIWMAIEIWDFGTLSMLLDGMSGSDQALLARRFRVPNRALLTSWIRAIAYIRNVCAHHSRLWNRPPIEQPKLVRAGDLPILDHLRHGKNRAIRVYAVAAIVQYLLMVIVPKNDWSQRLCNHLTTFPNGNGVELAQSGFEGGWSQERLWA